MIERTLSSPNEEVHRQLAKRPSTFVQVMHELAAGKSPDRRTPLKKGLDREEHLEQLARDIIATLPQESLNILAKAFAAGHTKVGHSHWAEWIGKALPCPVPANELDALHREVIGGAL